jgi:hypothetical protein
MTEHVFDRGAIVVRMTTAVRIDDEVVQPRGQVSAAALKAWDQYLGRCDDLKATAGVLNTAHAHLVEVAVSCLEEGDHVGPGLHSFPQFLAWQTGVSTATAKAVDWVARRVGELPSLWAALRAGEISLDQAAVVAKFAPPELDASATQLARVATVSQLKTLLRPFGPDQKKGPGRRSHVSVNDLDDGCARIVGDLDADQAALVRKALDAMREDLFRQRRADAKAAAEETGGLPDEVEAPTGAEALAALAETALAAQEAEHPGSERYLISYHLQARADGKLLLLDDRSVPVPEYERRRVLCDHRFETILHDHNATPLSVGRATRHIGRKLRRAILHRHRHSCAVPGCDTRHGLEIHHIVHWEDGGATDTANLVALCRHHHRAHHQDLLHIEGNADLPHDADGALHIGPPGRPLPPVGTPTPPDLRPVPDRPTLAPVGGPDLLDRLRDALEDHTGLRAPARASTPTGERLDRRTAHLEPPPPPRPTPPRTKSTATAEASVEPLTEAGTSAAAKLAAQPDRSSTNPTDPAAEPPPSDTAPPAGSDPDGRDADRQLPPAGHDSPDGPPDAHGPPAA